MEPLSLITSVVHDLSPLPIYSFTCSLTERLAIGAFMAGLHFIKAIFLIVIITEPEMMHTYLTGNAILLPLLSSNSTSSAVLI